MSRKLAAEDVAMILELRSVGVRLDCIARYAYGITSRKLQGRLRSWGVS